MHGSHPDPDAAKRHHTDYKINLRTKSGEDQETVKMAIPAKPVHFLAALFLPVNLPAK